MKREEADAYKIGQKLRIWEMTKEGERGINRATSKIYTVMRLYPHCILLENEHGIRICPDYFHLRQMQQNPEDMRDKK